MGSEPAHFTTKSGGIDPSVRGYQVLFHANECNRCPGCGRAQWYVGRMTAECVFCSTALPLAEARWGESGNAWGHHLPTSSRGTRGSERRRHLRKEGAGGIVNLLVDGEVRTFVVQNLSAGGVAVKLSSELLAASSVQAMAASGELVRADLRWLEADAAGFQFARPLLLHVQRGETDAE